MSVYPPDLRKERWPTERFTHVAPTVIAAVHAGATLNQAFISCGVDRVTGWRWRQRDAVFAAQLFTARAMYLDQFMEHGFLDAMKSGGRPYEVV